MAHTLILGGGFGGVAAARKLRALRPDDDITLVSKATHFMMGFRKTDIIVGRGTAAEGSRPLKNLERDGITVVHGTVEHIDPSARTATVDGTLLEADAMVVALGVAHAPQAVPGLAEHGINVYGPDGVAAAAETLQSFDRGRIVIGIFGTPYTCPPAPFEMSMLIRELLVERGSKATYEVFSPLPSSLPVVGPAGCEAIEGRMLGVGIEFRRGATAERVEPGRVVMEGGDEVPFDLLLGVPPHRPPSVVADAFGGWIKPDPATLQTSFEGVYAVGDVTMVPMPTGKPLPKAGAFAADAAEVAAQHIAARLGGSTSDVVFEGRGSCFLETGMGEAMQVRGRFMIAPEPEVELAPPSRALVEEKRRFERETLAAWFGD